MRAAGLRPRGVDRLTVAWLRPAVDRPPTPDQPENSLMNALTLTVARNDEVPRGWLAASSAAHASTWRPLTPATGRSSFRQVT